MCKPRLLTASTALPAAAFLAACTGSHGPGTLGSAQGDFSGAFVVASRGALEVVLSDVHDTHSMHDDGGACDSRDARDRFERQDGVRLRLLAVEQAGDLRRVSSDFFAPQAVVAPPQSDPVPSLNAFVGARVRERTSGSRTTGDFTVAALGTLSLARAPNYDTGEVEGVYDLEVDGRAYNGAFITAFCPSDTAVTELAQELFDYCPLVPEAPYEPGTSTADRLRDIKRALAALGLSEAERDCWREQVIEPYCRNPFPSHWAADGDGGLACLRDAFDVCLGRAPRSNATCQP